ncbi:MAG TPA: agmatinase, partial [Rhodospirillaceae bacterium]|nr:agmatinase [Rhodospirillaceae bacterium]
MNTSNLDRLRQKYRSDSAEPFHDPDFKKVAATIFDDVGTRQAPFAGVSTFLDAPWHEVDPKSPDFGDLQVAMVGVPMDLGVTNRPGARFG